MLNYRRHPGALSATERKLKTIRLGLFGLVLTGLIFSTLQATLVWAAPVLGNSDFQKVWNRTDKPVAAGLTLHGYIWGPQPNTDAFEEAYADSPGGKRLVQYFDKSRMEINNPNGNKTDPFYVTNGLLVREMIEGRVQTGNAKFEQRKPAEIGIAGDTNDPNGPTYKSLSGLLGPVKDTQNGKVVVNKLTRDGASGDYSEIFAVYGVRLLNYIKETGHYVASPFAAFLDSQDVVLRADGSQVVEKLFSPTYYATGLPITEPYWVQVKVAGKQQNVLVQAFERRILTYTPANPVGFQVEMGNVGQHYYQWRYQTAQVGIHANAADTASLKNWFLADRKLTPAQAGVRVVGVVGDFARLEVKPTGDPNLFQGGTIIVKRKDAGWQQLLAGSAFLPEDYNQYGVPQALRSDPLALAAGNVSPTTLQGLLNSFTKLYGYKTGDINVLFAGVIGNYARLEVEPRYNPNLFKPAIYIMKWNGNGWTQLLVDNDFPVEQLSSLHIPEDLWTDFSLKV